MSRRVYLVPFLGDRPDPANEPETMLSVIYIAEFPRGVDGTCAYCHGDPCAETSGPESLIAKYFANFSWAETCPCCDGRPS